MDSLAAYPVYENYDGNTLTTATRLSVAELREFVSKLNDAPDTLQQQFNVRCVSICPSLVCLLHYSLCVYVLRSRYIL